MPFLERKEEPRPETSEPPEDVTVEEFEDEAEAEVEAKAAVAPVTDVLPELPDFEAALDEALQLRFFLSLEMRF